MFLIGSACLGGLLGYAGGSAMDRRLRWGLTAVLAIVAIALGEAARGDAFVLAANGVGSIELTMAFGALFGALAGIASAPPLRS